VTRWSPALRRAGDGTRLHRRARGHHASDSGRGETPEDTCRARIADATLRALQQLDRSEPAPAQRAVESFERAAACATSLPALAEDVTWARARFMALREALLQGVAAPSSHGCRATRGASTGQPSP
jgi:hypothetical protein